MTAAAPETGRSGLSKGCVRVHSVNGANRENGKNRALRRSDRPYRRQIDRVADL